MSKTCLLVSNLSVVVELLDRDDVYFIDFIYFNDTTVII
jgi:hypothetical protein